MRSLKICLLSCVSLFVFSCDPCKNLDCAYDDYYGQFRIVSATDGKDLVFGPNKIYDKNEIKFYTLNGTDTSFFQPSALKSIDFGNDTVLQVKFFPKVETAYIRLNNNDTDTLAITYETTNTKCCGTITEITNFRFNNKANLPGNNRIQEIKK